MPPEQDVECRLDVWDSMQGFWLDTDANITFKHVARKCANSKYSISELKEIYWNEVFPSLKFNLREIAGVWQGFDKVWLRDRILKKNKFGRKLRFIRRKKYEYEYGWWLVLENRVESLRAEQE